MNYFIEGLQGSGKSTLMERIAAKHPDLQVFHEGEYSPIELAWCAYVTESQYETILNRYDAIRQEIEEKSHREEDHFVICYTKIHTDIPGFYQDLEQHEIYNGRIPFDRFEDIVFRRFARWKDDGQVFECSLFQNIVEELKLFRNASDEKIISFYREIAAILKDQELCILYLQTDDVPANIDVIRKERSDQEGNELWFPLMLQYFNRSPYADINNLSGEEDLYRHFEARQELELRICREIFADRYVILPSKSYKDSDYPIR